MTPILTAAQVARIKAGVESAKRRHGSNQIIMDMDALIASLTAAREALEALLELCMHGDFRNGVTSQEGCDEGDYLAGVIIDRARAALGEENAPNDLTAPRQGETA